MPTDSKNSVEIHQPMGVSPGLCGNPVPTGASAQRLIDRTLAPSISEVAHLKPSNRLGVFYFSLCTGMTTAAIVLSVSSHPGIWLVGQMLLAVALLQWFALIHEAGHKSLFRTVCLNKYAGHVASFFAIIPFECWKPIHGMHHHWTGWQDLDATTATLVPRQLSWMERWIINVCWACWIPLFSTIYRINNYWHVIRLRRLFPREPQCSRITWNIILLLAVYAAMIYVVGFLPMMRLAGLGVLLTLVVQDPLILSQHTHIPMNHSHGEPVQPYAPDQQEVFTRSLQFPAWFSSYVLIHLDAHELHHMYSQVPGYHLDKIDYVPDHAIHWSDWLRKAKRIRGEVFLFQNSAQSGFEL